MSLPGVSLSDSAFLATVDARDRNVWRFLATLVLGLIGGLIVGLLIGAVALAIFAFASQPAGASITTLAPRIASLIGANGASLASTLMLMTLAVATNVPLALCFLAIAGALTHHRIREYLTAARRFRWRQLIAGLGLSVLVIGPLVAIGQLLDPHAQRAPILSLAPDLVGRAGYAIASIALLIPAAAAEEAMFRGWLLRQTAVLTRNAIVLMVVNGLLFSAVHGEFAPDAFITRTLMGAGFVYMTLRLGGIEFSTGAHAANNILIVLFIQPLTATPAPSQGLTPDSLFQDVFLFLAYVAIAELTARWAPLRRWSQADEATSPIVAPATVEHFS